MDGRLYGRHCDVKKPQLTIGYSAALTGEEKPRSGQARCVGHPFHCCVKEHAANQLPGEKDMSDWLHSLPVLWMAILVFGFMYLVTAGIYAMITVFAVGERARSFKAISPGLLSPLGVIFGLFISLTAAEVRTDNEKARAEIDREASALRSAAISRH